MPEQTPWAHLPNATLIDRMLAEIDADPEDFAVARDAARDAALDAALDAAWDAIAALVAWDDAADLLDKDPDTVRMIMRIGAAPYNHQACLLLPYVTYLHRRKYHDHAL